MGTPEFAVAPLDALIADQQNIAGVVTAPDKPAGRGRKPKASAVKKYAVSKDIEVLQPDNLKSADFQEDLKRLAPDLIIVVAFRMLPQKVWRFPKLGTFNLHASLLPDYRGAAPINWAIINGEKETGVTTFMIDKKIDTGQILHQSKLPIKDGETAGELHDRLQEAGAQLVVKTATHLKEGNITPAAQRETQSIKPAPKLNKQNTKIDWSQPGREIVQLILGLSPFPTAWGYFDTGDKEMRCKFYDAAFQKKQHSREVGSVFTADKNLIVAVQDGLVVVHKLQVSGKQRMNSKDFLNGFQLKATAAMR